MTYKKTKLASVFNIVLAILSSVILVALFIGWIIGLNVAEHSAGDAFGGVILFAVGLVGGGIGLVVGTVLSILTARAFKRAAASGDGGLGKYILSTSTKVFWIGCFLLFALVIFPFPFYGVPLGTTALIAAVLNVVVGVFDWISRKELLG